MVQPRVIQLFHSLSYFRIFKVSASRSVHFILLKRPITLTFRMNKAPVIGSIRRKEPSKSSSSSLPPSPPSSTNPYRREAPFQPPISPSTSDGTTSRARRSTYDTFDTQTDILDGLSEYGSVHSPPPRGDPGQYRMVIAIDYGTTFSGMYM